ncbi:MAG: ParB/RepB/Spo0J family partition protein [Blastocatellia bacterium]|nr:ParB/RepB/Spo0J family partition protein [Blastocatellia bacterium]
MPKKFQPPPSYLHQLSGRIRASVEGDSLVRVPLGQLRPNPHQPRKYQNSATIQALAESIQQQGILEPVIGRKESDGTYTIVAGHRRWAAAELAGLADLPLVEKLISDDDLLVTALIENLQREDLHPVDEIRALGQLVEKLGTQEKAAKAIGLARGTLSNHVRVLNLGPEILDYCAGIEKLTRTSLTQLLDIPPNQRMVAARILAGESTIPTQVSKPKQTGAKGNVFAFRSKIIGSGNSFAVQVKFRKSDVDEKEIIEALECALTELRSKQNTPS